MISPFHQQFLKGPVALWLGSADKNNIPDTIRCIGVIAEDTSTLRCFFTEKFSEKFRSNILENSNLTLIASEVYIFEGYQYKGKVVGPIEPCTKEEIEIQKKYMNLMGDLFESFGMDRQKSIAMYFYEPSFRIMLKVETIFDQAPKPNTGGEVKI